MKFKWLSLKNSKVFITLISIVAIRFGIGLLQFIQQVQLQNSAVRTQNPAQIERNKNQPMRLNTQVKQTQNSKETEHKNPDELLAKYIQLDFSSFAEAIKEYADLNNLIMLDRRLTHSKKLELIQKLQTLNAEKIRTLPRLRVTGYKVVYSKDLAQKPELVAEIANEK